MSEAFILGISISCCSQNDISDFVFETFEWVILLLKLNAWPLKGHENVVAKLR